MVGCNLPLWCRQSTGVSMPWGETVGAVAMRTKRGPDERRSLATERRSASTRCGRRDVVARSAGRWTPYRPNASLGSLQRRLIGFSVVWQAGCGTLRSSLNASTGPLRP